MHERYMRLKGSSQPRPLQVLLMFGPEYARSRGVDALEPLGIYLPGDKNYPGRHGCPTDSASTEYRRIMADPL